MVLSGTGLSGAGVVAAHATGALASGNANGSGSTSRYTLYLTGPAGSTTALGVGGGGVTIGSNSSLSGASSCGSGEANRKPTMPPHCGHSGFSGVLVPVALAHAGGA